MDPVDGVGDGVGDTDGVGEGVGDADGVGEGDTLEVTTLPLEPNEADSPIPRQPTDVITRIALMN